MRPEHVRGESDGWWWTCPKIATKIATKNVRHAEAVDLRVPLVGAARKVIRRRLDGVASSGWLFEDDAGCAIHAHGKRVLQVRPLGR